MPDFFSPEGLSLLQGYESSGNPEATNPNSSASGLYGFINSTWQTYAPQAGVDVSQYPTAASAPAAVQTHVASITPASNWLCPGCDAGITNAVANNPSLLSSAPQAPTSDYLSQDFSGEALNSPTVYDNTYGEGITSTGDGGYGATDTTQNTGLAGAWQGLIGTAQNLGGAVQSAAQGNPLGNTSSSAGFWGQLLGDTENLASRAGLVLIGIVLLAAAAYAMSEKSA